MSSEHFQNPLGRQDPHTEVLERAELPSVITTIRKTQTRWAGHVLRMSDSRIPKQLLYCMVNAVVVVERSEDSANATSTSPPRKTQHLTDQLGEIWSTEVPSTRSFNVPTPPKKNDSHEKLELTAQSTRLSPTGVRPMGGISMPVSASYPTYGHIAPLL